MERLRIWLAAAIVVVGVVSAARQFARLNAAARRANGLLEHARAAKSSEPELVVEKAREAIPLLELAYGERSVPVAAALDLMAEKLLELERREEARTALERSQEIHERSGDPWDAAMARDKLARLEYRHGRMPAAERWYRRMKDTPCEGASRGIVRAWAAWGLADVLLQEDRIEEARRQREDMLALPESANNRDRTLTERFWPRIAWVEENARDWRAARDAWQSTVEALVEAGASKRPAMAGALLGLARAHVELGDPAAARAALDRIEPLIAKDATWLRMKRRHYLARIALAQGDAARVRAELAEQCKAVEDRTVTRSILEDELLVEAMATAGPSPCPLQEAADRLVADEQHEARTRRHPAVAYHMLLSARVRLARGDARGALALIDEALPVLEAPEFRALIDARTGRTLRARAAAALSRPSGRP